MNTTLTRTVLLIQVLMYFCHTVNTEVKFSIVPAVAGPAHIAKTKLTTRGQSFIIYDRHSHYIIVFMLTLSSHKPAKTKKQGLNSIRFV